MAVTVTDTRSIPTDGTNPADGDNITPYSGDQTPTLVTGASNVAETTGAAGAAFNIAEGSLWYNCNSTNLSDTLLYVWCANFALKVGWKDTAAVNQNGSGYGTALGLYVSDGTNTVVFYFSGFDKRAFSHDSDLPVHYECLVMDTGETWDSSEYRVLAGVYGNLSWTAITDIGIYVETLSKALGGGQNAFLDIIRYGNNGLTITGGTTGDRGKFNDIWVKEVDHTTNEQSYGIIRKYSTGVFGLQGPLTFGETTTGDSWFDDSNITIIFEDRIIGDDKYFLDVVGSTTGGEETYFYLTGCTITTAGPHVSMDWSDAGIDVLEIDGCSFLGLGGAVTLASDSANTGHFIKNSTFDDCGLITVEDVTFENNTVRNCTATAMILSNTSHKMKDCVFSGNNVAIEIDTAGTYGFNNITFSGNTYDIENSAEATLYDSHGTGGSNQKVGDGTTTAAGQSFTGTGGVCSRAILRLREVGTATGNAVAKVYASTGANPNRTPTGSALATSNNVDVSGIGTSYVDVDFEFEDEFSLVNGTTYFIVLEYTGDVSNHLEWEYDNANGDTSNNFATYAGSWSAQSGNDGRYSVNVGGIVKINKTNGSNPGTVTNTATVKGATILVGTVAITITVKDKATRLPIQNVQTSVFLLNSPYTELMNEDTNSSGIADAEYGGGTPVDVVVKTRKSDDLDDPRYFPDASIQEITSSGLTLTISLRENTFI